MQAHIGNVSAPTPTTPISQSMPHVYYPHPYPLATGMVPIAPIIVSPSHHVSPPAPPTPVPETPPAPVQTTTSTSTSMSTRARKTLPDDRDDLEITGI